MHETGHAVFTHMHTGFLVVNSVTIEKSVHGSGVNHIIALRDTTIDIVDAFNFIVANVAGIVIEFTFEAGKRNDEQMLVNIFMYIKKRLTLGDSTKDSFDGDLANIMPTLNVLSEKLNQDKEKIIGLAVIFIHRCLSNLQGLWEIVDEFSDELITHKTLDKVKIDEIFKRTGYETLIIKHRKYLREEVKSMLESI